MTTAITTARSIDNHAALVPTGSDGDNLHRLKRYADWLNSNGDSWLQPDLAAYRDWLKSEHDLANSSIASHLATVRGRYNALLREDTTRDALRAMVHQKLGDEAGFADIIAGQNELLSRLENAVHPSKAKVKVVKAQDVEDSKHVRLTLEQASALAGKPGVDTLRGLRDTALLALALCTGLRESELAALEVEDLRQELGGELSVRVKVGKGAKKRLVPYSAGDWCLPIIDSWLACAGIQDGRVFRSINKGGRVTGDGITRRTVIRIVKRYPVVIRGQARTVCPHDLRRSYARLEWEAGTDIEVICQNLGHIQLATTRLYIGTLDGAARRGKAVIPFDLSVLDNAPGVQQNMIE